MIELSLLKGDVEKQLRTLEKGFRDFGTTLKSIGTTGLKISAGLAGILAFPVKLAADMEMTRAQFKALIGDAEQANKIISQLEGFALVTPLGAQDLAEAARQLLNFGVAVEDVVPTIKRLGEISGGDAERMSRLAYAFGQVTAAGRLMGTEVRQFVEAGFNPLQEISRTTGESMESLRKRLEAGQISVAEVAKAMETAVGAGGRFNGLLAEMAGTTIGQLNELKESFILAVRPLGEALLPVIKDLLTQARAMIPPITEWVKNNKQIAVTLGKILLVIGPVSAGMVALGVASSGLAVALSPITITIIGVTGALWGLSKAFRVVTDDTATWTDKIVALLGVLSPALAAMHALGLVKPGSAATPGIPNLGGGGAVVSFGSLAGSGAAGAGGGVAGIKSAKANATGGPLSPQGMGQFFSGAMRDMTSRVNSARFSFDSMLGQADAAASRAWSGIEDIAERQADRADAIEELDDDIAREKINAIHDQSERERAMLRLEHSIRLRELKEDFGLSPELQAKADALLEAQLGNVDALDEHTIKQEGVFDAQFAGRQFGGVFEEPTRLLRKIAKNTDPFHNGGGGIPVA